VRGRSKVILTCRTHYFTTQAAEREGIAGSMPRGGELFAEVEGRRNYAIVYLEPFSPEQVREFVRRHHPENTNEVMEQIGRLDAVEDLATRPVLLEMILKTLPRLLKQSGPLNLATLYETFTRLWLDDVAKGDALTPQDKLRFSQALAIKLICPAFITARSRSTSATSFKSCCGRRPTASVSTRRSGSAIS
jgi:hypothetical protein